MNVRHRVSEIEVQAADEDGNYCRSPIRVKVDGDGDVRLVSFYGGRENEPASGRPVEIAAVAAHAVKAIRGYEGGQWQERSV